MYVSVLTCARGYQLFSQYRHMTCGMRRAVHSFIPRTSPPVATTSFYACGATAFSVYSMARLPSAAGLLKPEEQSPLRLLGINLSVPDIPAGRTVGRASSHLCTGTGRPTHLSTTYNFDASRHIPRTSGPTP